MSVRTVKYSDISQSKVLISSGCPYECSMSLAIVCFVSPTRYRVHSDDAAAPIEAGGIPDHEAGPLIPRVASPRPRDSGDGPKGKEYWRAAEI